jgi:hypothetical protein
MEAIEKGTHSLKKVSKSWDVLLNSLSNHLNGNTRNMKIGPACVLTKEENATMVAWVLRM